MDEQLKEVIKWEPDVKNMTLCQLLNIYVTAKLSQKNLDASYYKSDVLVITYLKVIIAVEEEMERRDLIWTNNF